MAAAMSLAAQGPADVKGNPVNHNAAETRVGPDTIYPDVTTNPGATNPDVTQANIGDNICNKNWKTTSIRPPASYTTKAEDQTAPRIRCHRPPDQDPTRSSEVRRSQMQTHTDNTRCYEEDHIVSLQNGGAPSDERNLYPEAYNTRGQEGQRRSARKDKVENFIHNGICLDIPNAKLQAGAKPTKSMTLEEGQRILAIDWYACYRSMVAKKDCVHAQLSDFREPDWLRQDVRPIPKEAGSCVAF